MERGVALNASTLLVYLRRSPTSGNVLSPQDMGLR